jgi:hypothetical protein
VLSYEQGVVLLNHLNWRPRPVFQSYSAYTPFLLSLNGTYFASQAAPSFVLLKLEAIDNRLPALEDSQAIFQILQHYEPILEEKSFLLFERRQGPQSASNCSGEIALTRSIAFNEEVPVGQIPGNAQKLTLGIQYSWLGRLKKTFYRPTPLFIRLTTEDGKVSSYRIVPSMTQKEFLLNPLVRDNEEFVQLYGNEKGLRVVSFALCAESAASWYYQPRINLTLRSFGQLVQQKLPQDRINALCYPMLAGNTLAVRSQAPVLTQCLAGTEVLLLQPEGEICMGVSPTSHVVQAAFGIMPEAYERGKTDGVAFAVEYVPEKGVRQVLYERYLDPASNPSDRGMQSLSVPLPPDCRGKLLLKTTNPPGKNPLWDWSYWTGVSLK